ncbi:MAG: hypothetical protein ACOVLB_01710 [Candidatus Nanopelagicus sp.]
MPLTQVKTSNLDTTNSLFFRNRIINGDMRIDQRKAGASLLVNGNEYTVDRWNGISYVSSSFAQKFTTGRNLGSVTPPAGFTNYLGISVTTAYTSWASGDFFNMVQFVEGYSIADFAWGTASAKPVTLSFWVRGSVTGTYTVAIRNQDSNRSYATTYTISAANTWTYVSITIPGETSGTWYTDNSRGLELNFDLGRHSSYETSSSNTWSTSGSVRIAGTVRLLDTANATLYITGVQLEVGTAATAFERRPYGTELQLCQRYYQKSYPAGTVPGSAVSYNNMHQLSFGTAGSGIIGQHLALPVVMRTAPTLTVYDAAGTSARVTGLGSGAQDTNGVSLNTSQATDSRIMVRIFGVSYAGLAFMYAVDAEL